MIIVNKNNFVERNLIKIEFRKQNHFVLNSRNQLQFKIVKIYLLRTPLSCPGFCHDIVFHFFVCLCLFQGFILHPFQFSTTGRIFMTKTGIIENKFWEMDQKYRKCPGSFSPEK